jgi:fructoselysine-6-P-deglycase FrlB-like protein
MGKAYSDEMQQVPATVRWAADQPVEQLQRAVRLYRDRGLLAIGSGGSFTAAALAADLHLRSFGRPSQAITPLDVFQLPGAASSVAAGLLLSAEGKNADILAAARQLLLRGCPSIGLTLRASSPLVELCSSTSAAALTCYDMPWGKDGYLATNSLIATLVLLWRAYCTDSTDSEFEAQLAAILEWHDAFRARLEALALQLPHGGRALILHGIDGRIGAIDLESKLAEGALAFGQVCNFRQFAHGRHLQLHEPGGPLTLISLSSADDQLGRATRQLIPHKVGPVLDVVLPALRHPGPDIAAVLAAFTITQVWAGEVSDPGRPDVPQFGRDLHGLDVSRLVAEPLPMFPAIASKRADGNDATVLARSRDYLTRLQRARVRALVCDFDGTFCDTVKRFDGLDACLVPEISRLARAGVHIAFATGRGAKLAKDLRKKLPQDVWPHVTLGCYSGSHIFKLDTETTAPPADPRLAELAQWLRASGALPTHTQANLDTDQLGLRGVSGEEKWRLIAAINEWVAVKRCEGWRTFSSGHSVDVISEKAGKLRVVEHVRKRFRLDPLTQILRLGDAGDFGGNDYELLSEGLALSVDAVSPGAITCWNLLPRTLRGVRGTAFYLQGLEAGAGEAWFSPMFLKRAAEAVQQGLGSP